MKKTLFFTLILFASFSFSQIRQLSRDGSFGNNQRMDSLPDNVTVKLSGKTAYTDYKIINYKGDTTLIDTTLTLKKEYLFNFRRKDHFELQAFQNQGQTFTNLGYHFSNISLQPSIGFTAKKFNFYQLEDIYYYDVPTPTTEILYRSGNEQGQVLDALFTLNFSKRFNVAIAYKGLRSLGYYRRTLANHGNFRASFRYESPKGQYTIKGNTAIQDINNQENGGITDNMVTAFITNNVNFKDRARIDVNLNNTESLLDGKRYYLEHSLRLFSTEKKVQTNLKDSLTKNNTLTNKTTERNFTNLKIGYSVLLDNQFYKFTQTTLNTSLFGEANLNGDLENTVDYELLKNEVFLDFKSKYILGNFRAKVAHSTFKYGYDSIVNTNVLQNINGRYTKIGGQAIGVGANWNAKINNFKLNASVNIVPGNSYLSGTDFRGELQYKKDSLFTIKGAFLINSKTPNFNTLLHQSNYNNYNWQNNFNNINTRTISGNFSSKWINAFLDLTNIDNYVFFDENGAPQQASENLNYLKVKVNKEFKLGKFALNNTLMYQNISSGNSFFRVPDFVTRNTLYYTDNWFKGKPLLVNIGVHFKYFSSYKANAFNPLINEFTLQNTKKIGNYPIVDFFFNGRVRRTRIYFKLENITSFLPGDKKYFSAPNHPYNDFSIRFGVVWNWFI